MKPTPIVGAPDSGKAVATVTELGHLASGVGHHVINAFSAVVSNAEILRLRLAMPDPPDPSVLAETIIRTSVEAAGVARRLIDVTRPLTQVGSAPLTLDRLVADYVAARSLDDPAQARWSAESTGLPPILGHEGQLTSMLDLLTANAIEAIRPGTGPVLIHLATSVDARGWIVLEVRDTGLGMAANVLERAVEPFFSTKAGHLGVGLSIANGIWRRHKGTLSVQSAPGDGTTIRLCVEPARF